MKFIEQAIGKQMSCSRVILDILPHHEGCIAKITLKPSVWLSQQEDVLTVFIVNHAKTEALVKALGFGQDVAVKSVHIEVFPSGLIEANITKHIDASFVDVDVLGEAMQIPNNIPQEDLFFYQPNEGHNE
jgi:hypothetical protein